MECSKKPSLDSLKHCPFCGKELRVVDFNRKEHALMHFYQPVEGSIKCPFSIQYYPSRALAMRAANMRQGKT